MIKTEVHQAFSKLKNSGKFTELNRSGRTRKTSPRYDHGIRRMVLRSPTTSYNMIRFILAAKDIKL